MGKGKLVLDLMVTRAKGGVMSRVTPHILCTACGVAIALGAVSCGGKVQTTGGREEANRVVVQHILIGFEESLPGKDQPRSQEEARVLALELFDRAKSGEDFDMLVETYTDDSFPGVYEMVNTGQQGDRERLVFERGQMAPAFGDVAFSLEIGEVGLAEYDPDRCRFGWHIIKRLE